MLKPSGRTAFHTIVVSTGLTKSAHRVAVRLGPRAVASTRPVDVLMAAAGFGDVEVTDLTEAFIETVRAWLVEYDSHEGELRVLLGDEWKERQSHRRDLIRGAEEGLLRRILVTGIAPAEPG
ncbi:MAG: hypothetical protein M3280_07680 [Actinomycetota bacterium]|nr:hypothetical protein [Actinomycetota bacterium]